MGDRSSGYVGRLSRSVRRFYGGLDYQPTNSVGTNGTPYRHTITTSDTKTDTGHTFTATPRPPNLTLTVIQGGVPAILRGRFPRR